MQIYFTSAPSCLSLVLVLFVLSVRHNNSLREIKFTEGLPRRPRRGIEFSATKALDELEFNATPGRLTPAKRSGTPYIEAGWATRAALDGYGESLSLRDLTLRPFNP